MSPTENRQFVGQAAFDGALVAVGFTLLAVFAVVATVVVHPIAGLGAVVGAAVLLALVWRELPALYMLAFALPIVPFYVRFPGLAILQPVSILTLSLVGLLGLRILMGKERAIRTPLHWLVPVYLATILASAAIANPPYFSPLTVREVHYHVLLPFWTFAIVYSLVRSERQAHRLLTALTAGTVACSVYAMVEYGLRYNVLLTRLIAAGGEVNEYLVDIFQYGAELPADGLYRTYATFINPIEFATFLTVVLPYPTLAALHHRSRRARMLYGLAAIAILVALVLTFSRGAWITAVVIGGLLFLFDRSFRRLTFPLAVTGLTVAIILTPIYGERVKARILDSATVSTRFGLNRLAFYMWTEHPVIGVGYGNIRNTLVPYADKYGEKWMEEPVEWFSLTEVTYTQLLAETGLLGLSVYLSMLYVFFAACYRRVREGGPSAWLAAAVGLGGLAFAFNGLGSGTTLVMVMATQAFWIMVGLALRLSSLKENGPAEEAVPQDIYPATGGATP